MATCWVCNPLCGKCCPPRMVSITCPQCGKINVFDLQLTKNPEARSCSKCHADLTWDTVPSPAYCKRYEIECGNPCAQYAQDSTDDTAHAHCPSRIEPLK